MFFQRSSARLSGSTLIELAIALPVALFVAVAALDIANVIRAQGALHEGLKAAARCMTATDGSCASVAAVTVPSPGAALFSVTLNQPNDQTGLFLETAPAGINVPYVYLSRSLPALDNVTPSYQSATIHGAATAVAPPSTFTFTAAGDVFRSAEFTVPASALTAPDPSFDYDCIVEPAAATAGSNGAPTPSNPYSQSHRCASFFSNAGAGGLAATDRFSGNFANGSLVTGEVPDKPSFHRRFALLTVMIHGQAVGTAPGVNGHVNVRLAHRKNNHTVGTMDLGGQEFASCLANPPVSPEPSPAPEACPRSENFAIRGHFDTHQHQQYLIPVERGEEYAFEFYSEATRLGTSYHVSSIEVSFTQMKYVAAPRAFDCGSPIVRSDLTQQDTQACQPLKRNGQIYPLSVAIPDPHQDLATVITAQGTFVANTEPQAQHCAAACAPSAFPASELAANTEFTDYRCVPRQTDSCGTQVTQLGQSCSPQALCATVANQHPSAHCVASFLRQEATCPTAAVQRAQTTVNGAQALEAFYGTLEAAMPAERNCTGSARCATISPDPSTFAPGTHRSVALNGRYEVPLMITLGQSTFAIQASYTDAFEHSAVR